MQKILKYVSMEALDLYYTSQQRLSQALFHITSKTVCVCVCVCLISVSWNDEAYFSRASWTRFAHIERTVIFDQ